MALSEKELELLREVVSLPTAPFCELAVQDYIRTWSKANGFSCKEDKVGNLLVAPGPTVRPSKTPWVLQAHMDHPGFVLIECRGKTAKAWFRGGVDRKYFAGTPIKFMPTAETGIVPVKAVVKSVVKHKATGFLKCNIMMERAVQLPVNTLGMWDLPAWKRQNNYLSLRAADDLAGVAAVLLTLSRLKRMRTATMPLALFTRAEEVGFVGAVAAAKSGLIKKGWPILGIETSKAQMAAPLGKGAVIRLGDKMSMFDPQLTMNLRRAADKILAGRKHKLLEKDGSGFAYNAALMPGGSTESTLLALMGYRTCAVCLPLGNYHNMAPGKIAPEKITISDMASLVELLLQVSQEKASSDADMMLKQRILNNFEKRKGYLCIM